MKLKLNLYLFCYGTHWDRMRASGPRVENASCWLHFISTAKRTCLLYIAQSLHNGCRFELPVICDFS